jgi:hypothetical protein
MQANRRKVTWFNMQKLVVNDYALGILVLKVTTTPQGSYFNHMRGSMPLMTVSTAVITVLHSAEVVHIPHE